MVSISHIEDLPPRELLAALGSRWNISEKIDGTYLASGLDSEGRFYTQRKNAPPCHSMEDWSSECWAQTFRLAHHAMSCLIDTLVEGSYIAPGQHLTFEIVRGNQPNAIYYTRDQYHNSIFHDRLDQKATIIFLTSGNFEISKECREIISSFECRWSQVIRLSGTGRDLIEREVREQWNFVENASVVLKTSLLPINHFAMTLDQWLMAKSNVESYTHSDVLEIKLNQRPKDYQDFLPWNQLKVVLKKERSRLREIYQFMVLVFKSVLHQYLNISDHKFRYQNLLKEGTVVTWSGGIFKVVDRPFFSALNLFTHRVQYGLVGGRRPRKSSFLSRTATWTKEERLRRLDTLLDRYLKNRLRIVKKIPVTNSEYCLGSITPDLHQRNLNLFKDLRQRIEDGR